MILRVLRGVVCLMLTGIASCSGLRLDKVKWQFQTRTEVPPDPLAMPGGQEGFDLLMGEGEILFPEQAGDK